MAKQLLLVGDSNVRRFFNQLGSAYSASVDLVQARNLTEWSEAIPACKRGYEIVVYSFLTNLIVDAGQDGPRPEDRLDSIDGVLKTVVTAMK